MTIDLDTVPEPYHQDLKPPVHDYKALLKEAMTIAGRYAWIIQDRTTRNRFYQIMLIADIDDDPTPPTY